jgi:hypothetical protein
MTSSRAGSRMSSNTSQVRCWGLDFGSETVEGETAVEEVAELRGATSGLRWRGWSGATDCPLGTRVCTTGLGVEPLATCQDDKCD